MTIQNKTEASSKDFGRVGKGHNSDKMKKKYDSLNNKNSLISQEEK